MLGGLGCDTGAAQYDVIDTSNLADYIGILNVLPAAIPLLSPKCSSVLNLENLLPASEDPTKSLLHNALLGCLQDVVDT